MEPLLTTPEVAALLRVHENTILNLSRRGLLPSVRVGYCRRFERADVLAYVERHKDGRLAEIVELRRA